MVKTIAIIFILLVSTVIAQDTTTVEMAVRPDSGYVLILISPERRNAVWAEMIIRGTHDGRLGSIAFSPVLYKKYYHRVVEFADGRVDTVEPFGSFRAHLIRPGVKSARDVEIRSIQNNLREALRDLKASGIVLPVRIADWPWGSEEIRNYALHKTVELSSADLLGMAGYRYRLISPEQAVISPFGKKTKRTGKQKTLVKKTWLKRVQ